MTKLKISSVALQVDESTEVSGRSHLLEAVRFVLQRSHHTFCRKELPENMRGQEMYHSLYLWFEKLNTKMCW
jgi:hypothetical protein